MARKRSPPVSETSEKQSNEKSVPRRKTQVKTSYVPTSSNTTVDKEPPGTSTENPLMNATNHVGESATATKRRKTIKSTRDTPLASLDDVLDAVSCGVMLGSGSNEVGQIGQDVELIVERRRPQVVPMKPPGSSGGDGTSSMGVKVVAAGAMHTVCITGDYQVYSFGCNDEGALGRMTRDEDECCVPRVVPLSPHGGPIAGGARVVQVTCGDSHTAMLTTLHHVYYTGCFRDSDGRFSNTVQEPVRLECEVPIKAIVSGYNHIVMHSAITDTVYSAGDGSCGQLGRVSQYFATRGGRRGASLHLTPAPVHLPRVKVLRRAAGAGVAAGAQVSIRGIHAGGNSTYITMDNDTVLAWGLNSYGQLGIEVRGPYYMPVVVDSMSGHKWNKICASNQHCLALDDNGVVYSLGSHQYGKLGLGSHHKTDVHAPTRVHVAPHCEHGPHGERGATAVPHRVVDISVGSHSSYAVLDNGEAYAWGFPTNWCGSGADDSDDDVHQPTRILGKQLDNRRVEAVTAGSQHLILKAVDK